MGMVKLFVGTSGFSYKEWKNSFYPADLPVRQMLTYYGRRLPAVEINNTFYRMPQPAALEAWAAQVPPGFRFALKAPRGITHYKPLEDKGEQVDYLYRTAAALGKRMGPVLFQLPPYLRKDAGLLAAFIDLLPQGALKAFEFRHPSWFDEAIFHLLRSAGCALCCADSQKEELRRFEPTAEWGYVRLRRPHYGRSDLAEWVRAVSAQKWREAYVFFKHEEAGAAPELAGQFLELAAGGP